MGLFVSVFVYLSEQWGEGRSRQSVLSVLQGGGTAAANSWVRASRV